VSGSDFRDLEVWKKARELALGVYKLTADGPLAGDFGLRDQMRRTVVSICSNIASGVGYLGSDEAKKLIGADFL